jgi:hypothetical protein
MPKKERDRELDRRRHRKEKIRILRHRLAESKDAKVRSAIIQKILKIDPLANVPQK